MKLRTIPILWSTFATITAAIASKSTRSGLKKGWTKVRRAQPPDNPDRPDVSWVDALLWAALSGLVVGVVRVLVQRGSASIWRRVTKHEPPARR